MTATQSTDDRALVAVAGKRGVGLKMAECIWFDEGGANGVREAPCSQRKVLRRIVDPMVVGLGSALDDWRKHFGNFLVRSASTVTRAEMNFLLCIYVRSNIFLS